MCNIEMSRHMISMSLHEFYRTTSRTLLNTISTEIEIYATILIEDMCGIPINPTMPLRYPPELAIALYMKIRDPDEVEDILSFQPDIIFVSEPKVPSFVAGETKVRTTNVISNLDHN